MHERAEFDKFIEHVLADEGGYVNDPNDAGGETNYGITKARYPNEDIKNLTKERAIYLYYHDFWKKFKCDRLPKGVNYFFFDMVVQHGRAVEVLQRAVGAKTDNIIGPQTLAKAMHYTAPILLEMLTAERAIYYIEVIGMRRYTWYQKLFYPNATFANGWKNRLLKVRNRARDLLNDNPIKEIRIQPLKANKKLTTLQRLKQKLIKPPQNIRA